MKKTIVGIMTSVFCCACLLADVASATNTGGGNDHVDYEDDYDIFAPHMEANRASSTYSSASQPRQSARLSGLSRSESFAVRTNGQRSPTELKKSSVPMRNVINKAEASAPHNNGLLRSTLSNQHLSLSNNFDHQTISSISQRRQTPIDANDTIEDSEVFAFPVKPRYSHRASMFGKDRGYVENLGTYMKHIFGNSFEATCNINSNGLSQVPAALETLKQYFKTIVKMHQMPFSANEANKFINHDIASVNKFLSAIKTLLVGSKDSVFAKAYKQLSSQQEFRLLTPALAQRFREAISEEQDNLSTNLLARAVDGIIDTMEELKEIFEELKPFNLQKPQSSENEVIYQLGEKLNAILEMWKQQFAQDSETAVQDADLTNYISQNSPKAKVLRAASTMKAGINTGISRTKGMFGRNQQESDVNSREASATGDQKQGGLKSMLNRIRRH